MNATVIYYTHTHIHNPTQPSREFIKSGITHQPDCKFVTSREM